MIKLGVNKLPEIEKDNTDRNRTSPFAFTGAKFEFRAVGGSASIAFPVMLLNATVAEAIGELTERLRDVLKKTKNVDDAVLKVVREVFKDTTPVRFEGNNYSAEWVDEAARPRAAEPSPHAGSVGAVTTRQSRTLFSKLGILTKAELESRYHVRLERYVKDMLIELHTMLQLIDTMILPAGYAYGGSLAKAASDAKGPGSGWCRRWRRRTTSASWCRRYRSGVRRWRRSSSAPRGCTTTSRRRPRC